MRILGILGGLGPESTTDYYRSIIARYRALRPGSGYPHIVVNSLDADKVIDLLNSGRLSDLADYLSSGIELLARAGAHIGCIAANTPHLVFDEVQRRSAIPLISIVRATAIAAHAQGLSRVGLFGTGFTMRAKFYPDEFRQAGIEMVVPTDAEREFIHGKYIGELLNNQFLPETRDRIMTIAQRMATEDGIQALVLAGTELPLLLRGSETPQLPFLDTTAIHVEAIVNELINDPPGNCAR